VVQKQPKTVSTIVGRDRHIDHGFWGIGVSSVSIPFTLKWLKSSLERPYEKSRMHRQHSFQNYRNATFWRISLHRPTGFAVEASLETTFHTVSEGTFSEVPLVQVVFLDSLVDF
jgi:hypothetical protein